MFDMLMFFLKNLFYFYKVGIFIKLNFRQYCSNIVAMLK